MNKSLLLAATMLLFPVLVAGYYSDSIMYPTGYVPDNYEEAIDNDDFEECESVLNDFYTAFNKFEDVYKEQSYTNWPNPISFSILPEVVTIGERQTSLASDMVYFAEEAIRICLVNKETYEDNQEIEEALEECDFDEIEDFSKEVTSQHQSDIRKCEWERAFEECDLEYLDGLSGGDKVKFSNEIAACRVGDEPEPVTVEPEPEPEPKPVIQPVAEPVQVSQPITPTPISAPVSVSAPAPAPVAQQEVESDESDEQDAATTSDSETLELTPEELDRLVEERVAEAMQADEPEPEPAPEKKPNIFKRIWNFFTGWF